MILLLLYDVKVQTIQLSSLFGATKGASYSYSFLSFKFWIYGSEFLISQLILNGL